MQAGADGAAENGDGKTPAELAAADPRNPISQQPGVLAVLENAAVAGAAAE